MNKFNSWVIVTRFETSVILFISLTIVDYPMNKYPSMEQIEADFSHWYIDQELDRFSYFFDLTVSTVMSASDRE